jgi:hypothetical protein
MATDQASRALASERGNKAQAPDPASGPAVDSGAAVSVAATAP